MVRGRSDGPELTFLFAEAAYAGRFCNLNQDPQHNPDRHTAEASETLHRVQTGTRFVMFQFVTSLGHLSFLLWSAAHAVGGDGATAW